MSEQLKAAAKDLVMQAYGAQRYGSHAPTRFQWLNLGSALVEAGIELPADWAEVFGMKA